MSIETLPVVTEAQVQIPESVYYVLGFIILTNLGTIATVLGAAFRVVYKFAVIETQTKALHKRLDALENKRYNADVEDESDD